MSFLILPSKFNSSHVHFGSPVKNNESDGKFCRIVYSTKNISFNGVGIFVDFVDAMQEIHYKKTFIRFDPAISINAKMITLLQQIETDILEKYVERVIGEMKHCVYSLAEQLNSRCIKAYTNDASDTDTSCNDLLNCHVMLKICGVWETKGECGIFYKFIKC